MVVSRTIRRMHSVDVDRTQTISRALWARCRRLEGKRVVAGRDEITTITTNANRIMADLTATILARRAMSHADVRLITIRFARRTKCRVMRRRSGRDKTFVRFPSSQRFVRANIKPRSYVVVSCDQHVAETTWPFAIKTWYDALQCYYSHTIAEWRELQYQFEQNVSNVLVPKIYERWSRVDEVIVTRAWAVYGRSLKWIIFKFD